MALGFALLWGCGDGSDGGFTRVPARGFFQPEAVDFGERAIGETAQADVMLTNSSVETLLFDRVEFEGTGGSAFAARTSDGNTLRGTQLARNASIPISILFGPSEEVAYSAEMVVFAKELAIELEVRGYGRLIPPATPGLTPTAIAFGAGIEVGRDVSQALRITNVGERPGRLSGIRATPPFSVTGAEVPTPEMMPGDAIDVMVHFQPITPGPASASIRFEMDSGATADLPVNGTAIPRSNLACFSSSLDFGPVLRGESDSRGVTCTGDGPYTVFAIEVVSGAPNFSVLDISPAPGSTSMMWTFEVEFTAMGIAGSRSGRIEVVGATGARTPIDVTGEVLAPPPSVSDLRVAMSWSAAGTDFDLHLVRAGELPYDPDHDCHFAAKTIDWGTLGDATDDPFLDRDDTSGPGAEEVNLVSARDQFYDAYVMYFDDGAITDPVDIAVEYNLGGTSAQTVTHAMSICGNMWHVGTFDFRTSPATFTPGGTETDQWSTRTEGCRP
jgi:hypothetical protein